METSTMRTIHSTNLSSRIVPAGDAGIRISPFAYRRRAALCSRAEANSSRDNLKTPSVRLKVGMEHGKRPKVSLTVDVKTEVEDALNTDQGVEAEPTDPSLEGRSSTHHRQIARVPTWKELRHKVTEAMKAAVEVPLTHVINHLFVPVTDEPCLIERMGVNFGPVPEIGEKVQVYVTEGAIPKDFPPGCYVRNGPNAMFGGHDLKSPFGKSLYHWFEGDGMLHATWFEKDGTLWYKNKYVETESFKLEKERGRSVYLPTMDENSTCSLRFNRFLNTVRFGEPVRNPGNVSIFQHGGRVLTGCEGGKPYEIDISDLSTVGECTWNGQWERRYTGAHPKVTPDSHRLVLYGFDILKPYYRLGVVSADGEKVLHTININLDRLVLIHDIAVTHKYAVLLDFPVVMDIKNMILKGDSLIKIEDTYSRIGVIPLEGDNKDIKWFDVNLAYSTHVSNAYHEDDEVVVHAVVTRLMQLLSLPHDVDKFEFYTRGMTLGDVKDPSIDGVLYEHLHEWRLNLRTGEVVERDITRNKFPLELPRINDKFNGKNYQFCYVASEDIESSKLSAYPKFGRLAKIDVSRKTKEEEELKVWFHEMGPDQFCQEPVFVARPGGSSEDDGWIVTYVYNEATDTTQVIIIDAKNFEDEPVARITLPQRVPYGFHGAYIHY